MRDKIIKIKNNIVEVVFCLAGLVFGYFTVASIFIIAYGISSFMYGFNFVFSISLASIAATIVFYAMSYISSFVLRKKAEDKKILFWLSRILEVFIVTAPIFSYISCSYYVNYGLDNVKDYTLALTFAFLLAVINWKNYQRIVLKRFAFHK